DAEVSGRADANVQGAGLRVDREVSILVTLDDAEDALFGDHLGTVGARNRLAFLGRHLIDALLLAAAGAQGTEDVGNLPDAILIDDKHVAVAPRQTIRPVQIFDVAIDPLCSSSSIVSKEGEISSALFRDQYVSVGQHQQPAWVDKPCRERRSREARGHFEALSAVGENQ